jgi:orotidine-5'-phosphate decarboxylase
VIYKVGSELFLAAGPDFVRELVHEKNRVFLDLKFHDIPNTVVKAVQQASFLHVDMFTLHLAGGGEMVKSVVKALADIPTLKPKILGVSVLTSFDDIHWAEMTKTLAGHALAIQDSVHNLISAGAQWGVDGVVCSAHELSFVAKKFPSLYSVIPGIRPQGSSTDDQARVMTPAEARKLGASAIVVGRPITQASHPRKMAESILKELAG